MIPLEPGKPALAILAKAPVPGAVKTRLCPPLRPEEAADLCRAFLQDCLDRARAVPAVAAYLAYTPAEAEAFFTATAGAGIGLLPQGDGDLGQRMASVAGRLLAAGHPAVLLTGTDSPTLPAELLAEAADRLLRRPADLLLGPTADGGYYLLGLRRPLPGLFGELAWGTDAVLAQTLERAAAAGLAVELLPGWYDVDTGADLRRLAVALEAGEGWPARRTRAALRALARDGRLGAS